MPGGVLVKMGYSSPRQEDRILKVFWEWIWAVMAAKEVLREETEEADRVMVRLGVEIWR